MNYIEVGLKLINKNKNFMRSWVGKGAIQTFNKLRKMGYDVIIEDNGDRYYLYPDTLRDY